MLVRNSVLHTAPVTPPTGSTDPLVGRQRELALLRRLLADARGGAGHLVVVTGPAGIGKTRLVEELLSETSAPVGWGAAVADAGMPALWPWLRALRGLPGPHAAVAALADGAAQRGRSSAEESAAVTFAADTVAVDALAERATADPGLLVVLDDLQWADQATVRLLERVAVEIRRLPLLIVGTHRDAVDSALPGSLSHRATEVVGLGPLSGTESAVVLSGFVDDADREALRRAAELSGGSPLYLRTLARVATGQLRGHTAWDDSVGERPELRHLVAVAMEAAGPDAADLAAALSVLGAEADPGLLAGLVGAESAGAVVESLLPAVPAGLVELPPSGTVRFAHALVRDAAYASLSPARRRALHRTAAELLEPLAVSRDGWAGVVAAHWRRAGAPEPAATWAIRAAEAAGAAGAHDEAARHLTSALDAVERHDIDADRAELLLDLARFRYLDGQLQQAAEVCVRAADEGERTGRAEVVCRAAITVQGVGHPEINQTLLDLCRRALAALDVAGQGEQLPLRARVEAQLSCCLLELEQVDDALTWSRTALEHAESSGDANAELDAIRARATLEWQPGNDAEMIALGGRALELADVASRPLARLWAHVWRSDGAVHLADMPAAWREVGAIRALADRTGLPLVRWHLLRREATLAALTGDFDGCRRLSGQAAEIAVGWGDISVHYTHFGQSTVLAMLRGDPGELTPGWQEMLPAVGSFPPVGKAGLAMALWLVGRRDEAEALYRVTLPAVTDPDHPLAMAAFGYMAELAPALGDVDGCRAMRRAIADRYGSTLTHGAGTVFYSGSVARILGELALGSDDAASAVAHFETGLRVDEQIGALPYVARGRFGLARAFAAVGRPARGSDPARAAAAQARRLGMVGLLAAADELLATLSARARAADPLTTREREVADLVAQAMSNRAIAEKLVVSERTVESHVSRILAKTGLHTRTELTRHFLDESPDGSVRRPR